MTFRTAARAVATASIALLGAASALAVQAQAPTDNQWRVSQTTLSTLLQNGYKIVAVVNTPRGDGGPADTIFVQRDQSAFKCVDPQASDAGKDVGRKAPGCYELAPPSGAATGSEAK
ncbi:hypothetical protein [Paraburkholderia rhynchosiae]|uniref:Uncharacterized protein n=1 Tax=Paraburkholderia rhynchosiae TaxID=487049 RepID=A0A2N7WR99_9BURK|nr:hypothetical protein [Paraburkholderia rhynchosiae]PMS31947.1 hypothetical protein C0Z16_09255 [Paraburkholderia rhynchosiae]CAB3648696.1 hypothetical protein LMG27174_01013 [Paraburkholderia rhynchosiae]